MADYRAALSCICTTTCLNTRTDGAMCRPVNSQVATLPQARDNCT